MEDTFRCKTQLQIYPSKRVNLTSTKSGAVHHAFFAVETTIRVTGRIKG